MKQTAAKLVIKALVTATGNYLVNYQGNFFYMDPAGNHLPSKYEREYGKRLKSQEWAWLKTTSKNEPVVLEEKIVKLAEKIKNKIVPNLTPIRKEKAVPAKKTVASVNWTPPAIPAPKNVEHKNTPFANLKQLVEK